MNILHKLSKDDIGSSCWRKIANTVIAAREGNVKIQSGGGGVMENLQLAKICKTCKKGTLLFFQFFARKDVSLVCNFLQGKTCP